MRFSSYDNCRHTGIVQQTARFVPNSFRIPNLTVLSSSGQGWAMSGRYNQKRWASLDASDVQRGFHACSPSSRCDVIRL
jgi:hypothetical protein